ncbi:hypothetical protein H7J77_07165 [Mycolicibacillus parakoreensis]|uniref:MmpS family protein n=2 Tax=Mycolicibacillus parakoreensis TaxID=1069221 RepID=A0ABY3U3A7_9MYCO|nr:hypothetical protein [Mycolicibacillus parakoreensis]ULN54441.1 MmpS family protein [Mycolicibacillus parakoreensis]
MPLVIVVVVVVTGFTVHRIRGFFGIEGAGGVSSPAFEDTEPFNPKVVTYEIFGPAGARVDINYLDLDAQPQREDGAVLPWSLTLESTNPAVSPNIVAQGEPNTLGCRIIVDDELKDERVVDGVHAQTFCLVKSA